MYVSICESFMCAHTFSFLFQLYGVQDVGISHNMNKLLNLNMSSQESTQTKLPMSQDTFDYLWKHLEDVTDQG